MINEKRMLDEFLELVKIDSESMHEGKIAAILKEKLTALGLECFIDDVGKKYGGEAGNVIGYLEGSLKDVPRIMLCAHMDTVKPGVGINPIIEGRTIRSDGKTILGADDKSGIEAILETIRVLKEEKIPHGFITVLFTTCEESGMYGAKNLDPSLIKADLGYILDGEEIGEITIKAPAKDGLKFIIHGLESHAGVAPERGINAIRIAAEAIAACKLGKIDDETTANIGIIKGGTATNIVPDLVEVHAESRSRSAEKIERQTAHMILCFRDAVNRARVFIDGKEQKAWLEESVVRSYPAYSLSTDSEVVKRAALAVERLGLTPRYAESGGGTDGNIINGYGIPTATIGCCGKDAHTRRESINIDDMIKTVQWVLEIIKG